MSPENEVHVCFFWVCLDSNLVTDNDDILHIQSQRRKWSEDTHLWKSPGWRCWLQKVHKPKVNSFWAEDKPLIPLATCSIIPTSIIPAKGSVYVHACECVFDSIIAGEG